MAYLAKLSATTYAIQQCDLQGVSLSKWGIVGTTSSPRCPQSNGESERFVQTLKRMLQKANFDHRDPYIALLEYRNTPVSGMTLSPAEMLMSRKLRTKLPDLKSALRPRIVNPTSQLLQRQVTYANHYDCSVLDARTLPFIFRVLVPLSSARQCAAFRVLGGCLVCQ